jgi:hypothetical protein
MNKTSVASFCILGLLSVGLAFTSPAQQAAVFPKLTASNLAKQKLVLPQDFAGSRNLLLIAFEREQQKDIDTWLPAAKEIEAAHENFRYYELPTIGRSNPLFRWYLDSAMRSGLPDNNARARTITLYVDKGEFRRTLDIPSESAISVLLVDKSGKVLWRATGNFTEEKKANLLDELKAAGV